MADNKQQAKVEDKKEELSTTMRCNLTNNTPGRRVIYDGITPEGGGNQKAITVEKGETAYNVLVARVIVEELRDQNRKKENSVLVPSPPTEAPKPSPVAAMSEPEPTAH